MVARWQWSLRTWVVWMPLAVAIGLALATPELSCPSTLVLVWFCDSVWMTFPAALAAGAIVRVKFPNRLISFWVAVGVAVIAIWVGHYCLNYRITTVFRFGTSPDFLAELGAKVSFNGFMQVRSLILGALIGGLLALRTFPAKVES